MNANIIHNTPDRTSREESLLYEIYSAQMPSFISLICASPEISRLKDVGMHCGCEYTSLPRFSNLAHRSRYFHSIGVGLIVWNFTRSSAQAISGLLHDIATPAFAHVVDFLNDDHLTQESTEDRTSDIIRRSSAIMGTLAGLGLDITDVDNYHLYPVADNGSPKLSADRLEYTLGNILNFGFGSLSVVKRIYENLEIGVNETGETELMFGNPDIASEFAGLALECGKVYVCDEDRYAMQTLAEVIRMAENKGILALENLYCTESEVIARLKSDTDCCALWDIYCGMQRVHRISRDTTDRMGQTELHVATSLRQTLLVPRRIPSKKRYIDPFVKKLGRVSAIDSGFRMAKDEFLATPQDYFLIGE